MADTAGALEPDPEGLPDWFMRVRHLVDVLTAGLNVLGTLLILGLMVLVNMDVIGRGLFNNPVSGVPEMVSMSIVAIVFLQVAQTFRKGRLTRSEAIMGFVARYSPRARHALDLIFSIAAILLIWQVLSASTPLFVKSWVRGTYEGTIGDFTAPVWPVKLIILIGCSALLVQLVLFGVAALLRLTKRANT